MKTRKGRLGLVFAAAIAMLIASGGVRAQSNDITVAMDTCGVGNAFRPGDIIGIRLQLTSTLDTGKKCQIQWEMRNADGDVVAYYRNVVVSPGAATPPVWLYGPISPHAGLSTVWSVRVFDFDDDRLGAEIGGAKISPATVTSQIVSDRDAMICVVGNRMGLSDYQGLRSGERPAGAHEALHLAGLAVSDLPDRWYGLSPYEAVVWSDAATTGLTVSQTEALTEYVFRGGHLIIVLPSVGNPWGFGNPAQARLSELLISQPPRLDEGVLLSEIAPVLTKRRAIEHDFETSIRVFKDVDGNFDVIDNHFFPILALPDNRVVAIQRTYGHGRVTLIGVNVAESRLGAIRMPQAEVFWNPILGRRNDTPRPDELRAMDDAGVLITGGSRSTPVVIGDGKLFQDLLAKTGGAAGTAIFAALVLFATYWFLAGPGGFLILKQRKMTQHSWLAFVITAAACTGVAWAGVHLLRQQNVEINHLTVLDFVARPAGDQRVDEPQYYRAFSWFSLYVAGYGGADVAIDSANGQHDVLSTYIPPERNPQPFPNPDRYTVDCANGFNFHSIPTRATATEMKAQFVGPLDGVGTIRVDPNDPVRVEIDPATGQPRLRGTVKHDLPGELTNAVAIWVRPDRPPDRRYQRNGDVELDWVPMSRAGRLVNNGEMFALARAYSRWAPGNVLPLADLGRATGQTKLDTNIYKRNMEHYESGGMGLGMSGVPERLSDIDVKRFLEMLSFYQGLRPPKYHKQQQRGQQSGPSFARRLGRELDLSAWLNRPCLIIIGYLENSRCPIPLRVDGDEPANSDGLTMVRWVYPLPIDESEIAADAWEDDNGN